MSDQNTIPTVVNSSPEALAADLANHITSVLQKAIDDTGKASLVLSGGSTPKPLFEALCEKPLDWSKIDVTLADERWVPESDKDSNAAMIKRLLLKGAAAKANFVGLYQDNLSPEDGVGATHRELLTVAQPFTVVVLGMGTDGHTASLFPAAEGADHAMADTTSLVAIVRPSSVPQARITLTLAALMNTECQILHITGTEKRALVDEVLADPEASAYPIARFLNESNKRIRLYTTD